MDGKNRGGRGLIPVLLATVLAMGGCAATHVGEAWQCPIKQGVACASVAEADPVVASPEKGRELTIPTLSGPGASCGGVCSLFTWFRKLLRSDEERADGVTHAGAELVWPEEVSSDSVPPDAQHEMPPDPAGESLRTKERIARIWIAPFVDEEGLYREGHWVRVVIEPAGWRLP